MHLRRLEEAGLDPDEATFVPMVGAGTVPSSSIESGQKDAQALGD